MLAALLLGCGGAPPPTIAGPRLERPVRVDHDIELYVVTAGRAGRSFRILAGGEGAPRRLAASEPTFYDGTSLVGFGRSTRDRRVELDGGSTLTQARVRLWEDDLLGTGHWVHDQGRYRHAPETLAAACQPADAPCHWREDSGSDVVSLTGTLRGVRRWSAGLSTGSTHQPAVSYRIHDRFGEHQDLLRLYGSAHRDLIAAAREQWEATPAEQREGYAFDYKSSILRPAPGGLVWVMHATATASHRQGTTLAVEVPAPLPAYGGIDPAAWGEPGELFRLADHDVTITPGTRLTVGIGGHSLALPGGHPDDPPLAALHLATRAEVPEAHRDDLAFAFAEVHDLVGLPAAPTVADGRLDDWADSPMLLLDEPVDVSWRADRDAWGGPEDASLAVAVRPTDDGWLLAARLFDDVHAPRAASASAGDGDHLELWLLGELGWVQYAIRVVAGGAEVEAVQHAATGEWPRPLPPDAVPATVTASGQRVEDDVVLEVLIPAEGVRPVDGKVGLRVLFADADDLERPRVTSRIGTTPSLVDAWLDGP